MSEEFTDKLNKYKIPLVLCLVGLVLIIGGAFQSNLLSTHPKPSAKPIQYSEKSVVEPQTLSSIKVDLSGAVKNPGVYTLNKDARVEDLIKSSGGFSASASAEFINKTLNLSQKLSDGQKLYIPFTGETYTQVLAPGSVAGVSNQASTKVGINSASESELDSLPGVGPTTAQKIIKARPYQAIEDLLAKKAVGKSVFEKIKDLVSLD